MRSGFTAFLLSLIVLTGCSSGNGSRPAANGDDATPSLQNVCQWLTPEWRDGANLSEGSPAGPRSCIYEDSIDGGVRVRISVRSRSRRFDLSPRRDDETAVVVAGLGAPAVWVTRGQSPTDRPATTTSTAFGTEDRVSGRLVVSPPKYLVTVHVRDEYNNSRFAEDVARIVLEQLGQT